MNHDEDMILGYLRKFPSAFVSAMEICKRAGDRKRFASEPDWAKPVLVRMTQQRVLECNITGQYRIKPEEEEEEPKKHGRPYEPRPEPAPPVAGAAVVNPKADVTAMPTSAAPRGEKEKTAPIEGVGSGAPAPANSEEAKKQSIPQVDGCTDGKAQIAPPPHGGGYAVTKKVA